MFGKELSRSLNETLKAIGLQNKAQASLIDGVMKSLLKDTGGGSGGMAAALKPLMGDLTKAMKLVEAQTSVLEGIAVPDLGSADDKGDAEAALKALEEAVRKINAENNKQASELESLGKEIEKAAKDSGGDKDAARKVKAAQAALEKALKLIDEQTRALDEAKKALAG